MYNKILHFVKKFSKRSKFVNFDDLDYFYSICSETYFERCLIENKKPTVIVTGASGGYGAGIAETFAKQGAQVFITARNEAKLKEVASRIGATAIGLDKTKTLGIVEPFDRAMGHAMSPLLI
jgi:NADPH:quinone reductase-like Zn-dependent oxidoreductase